MQREINGALAQLARAFDWQSKGHRFDSVMLHNIEKDKEVSYETSFFTNKIQFSNLKNYNNMNKRIFKNILCLVLILLSIVSCNRNKEITPSFDFAPYISAYTSGIIHSNSHIRIELAQEIEAVEIGTAIDEKLFSFSPSLKGKAYWLSNSTIEFVPDSGALKTDKIYHAKFFVNKIFDNVTSKQKTFEFSFYVQQKSAMLSLSPIEVLRSAPNEANITGNISFSDIVTLKEVKQAISLSGIEPTPEICFEDNGSATDFAFTIKSIAKTKKEQILTINFNGQKIGISKQEKKKIDIPALNDFHYISATPISDPENGICLAFSEPISNQQDIKGLVDIEETQQYATQIADNLIYIFYPTDLEKDYITINIDKGLKNYQEKQLNSSHQIKVKAKIEAPAIKLLSDGLFLPDATHQSLDFKAVSIQAVDLEVIRIYESNILAYLQNNSLNSSNYVSNLKQAGRLIYKKTLRLNADEKNYNKWQNYSINLKHIIQQEPGAMYRVILSFKQEYATPPFNNKTIAANNNEMVNLSSGEMTDLDEAQWDYSSNSYYGYYNDNYDWDLYEWSQSENPYHASYYMESAHTSVSTTLLASNLGMIVKANNNNKYWISVNDILSTKPILGVEINLYNYQLQNIGSGKTNADGFAEIEVTSKSKAFIAVASLNNEKTYLKLIDGAQNKMERFDVGGQVISKGLKGFIYGERGVWRPGDTLFLTFILEDSKHIIPLNHPVTLEIYNPRGQFAYKKISSQSENGFYTFAVPTKKDAPTGDWNAYVKIGQASFHKRLKIETIKPNRLKIDLKLENKQVQNNTKTLVNITSAWLTGNKANGLKTDVEITLSSPKTTFKGYEKYTFDNPAVYFEKTTIPIFSGTLNAEGKTSFYIPALVKQNIKGKVHANLVCRVFEPNGETSFTTIQHTISPFNTYVGIDDNVPNEMDIETNTDHEFKVVTLDANGKPKACKTLEYKIYKIDWSWWWENNSNDFSSYINNSTIKPIKSGQLATNSNGAASIKFRVNYPDYGRYLVYVKDKADGHATGCTIWVTWPSWRGVPDSDMPTSVKMLSFSTDKKSYKVGETVVVNIPKINSGMALVSIENGSEVVAKEWLKMDKIGNTQYKFVTDKRMSPNVYIHISLLQPHDNTIENKPIRMYGVQPIEVFNENTQLHPQITCPNVVKPESAFVVKVKEQKGQPMTYTLALVDEGLLGITNFKTPNPWKAFYTREALGITTWDMYDYIVGAFSGKFAKMFSIGGDEDENPSNMQANRFNPVVKFMGPFTLKKGEEKSHKIILPPYVGSLRVMVVAGMNEAYGNAATNITVRTPLMTQSTLPRMVGTNETIDLPVNIFAMENNVKDVTVKVSTQGKLKINGAKEQKIHFSNTGNQTLFFQLQSTAAEGVEKISVIATGNGQTFKENIEIDVRNPNPITHSVQTKLLKGGESISLPYSLAVKGGKNNYLNLELANLPIMNISAQYDFLENYTHYCSEQLTSKGISLLFLDKFKNLSKEEQTALDKNIHNIIAKIYGRQTPSGGFTYWEGGTDVNNWVTSYVGHFLILAKEKGYEINQSVVNKWIKYQRKKAQNWRANNNNNTNRRYSYNQSDLEQAYCLYTLALAGSSELGAMNRLKESNNLSLQTKWRLAAAYALIGKQKTANELVFNQSKEIESYAMDNTSFGSALRDRAMILETLILLQKHEDAFMLAKDMAANFTSNTYYSTQSTAYLLMSLAKLSELSSGSLKADYQIDNKETQSITTVKSVFVKTFYPTQYKGNVTITNKSDKLMFVNLTTRTKPLTDTASAKNNNLKLAVRYVDMKGKTLNENSIPQGTDFYAIVTISNTGIYKKYTDLALTYIVPSGWEIYNERLLTNSSSNGILYQDIRDDRFLTYFDLVKGQSQEIKIRLRAAYGGTFILPAITCEAMYDVNVFARTKASKTTVVRQ